MAVRNGIKRKSFLLLLKSQHFALTTFCPEVKGSRPLLCPALMYLLSRSKIPSNYLETVDEQADLKLTWLEAKKTSSRMTGLMYNHNLKILLACHEVNMPVNAIFCNFDGCKNDIFSDIFLIFALNIGCGYMLESPHS